MSIIHREATFDASAEKVFQTLADLAEFSKLTGAPATGKAIEGEAFSAFGGHITGRHIELVPGKRVVQAWRPKTWPEGKYSLVSFEIHAEGGKTRVVLEHTSFPEGATEHLAKGWDDNYWTPMHKTLGG